MGLRPSPAKPGRARELPVATWVEKKIVGLVAGDNLKCAKVRQHEALYSRGTEWINVKRFHLTKGIFQ